MLTPFLFLLLSKMFLREKKNGMERQKCQLEETRIDFLLLNRKLATLIKHHFTIYLMEKKAVDVSYEELDQSRVATCNFAHAFTSLIIFEAVK